jgi:hypothetical protein
MKSNTGALITMGIVGFIILFIIYDVLRNRELALSGIIAWILMSLFVISRDWGDLFPAMVRRGMEMFDEGGLSGTVDSTPQQLAGNKLLYRVILERRIVPRHLKLRYDPPFMTWFLDMVTGSMTIEVIASAGLFEIIHSQDCENPNGAIRFYGRFDGGIITRSKTQALQSEVDFYGQLTAQLVTKVNRNEAELAFNATINQYNMTKNAEWLERTADKVKKIMFVTKKGGMDEAMQEAAK